ncbi:CD209 antigen-like protein A, partial [Ruditapes philippinarum]
MKSLVLSLLFTVTYISTVACACQSGWTGFRDSCYQFNVDNKQSWNDAKNACHKEHATLVAIETQEESDFIADHLKTLISSS